MEKEQNLNFHHLELGDYLELLQKTISVDGKFLTNKDLCERISMSPKTYTKVKRAKV